MTQLLQNTENASYRAQELTRQLLTFAKGGAPVKETASVLEIIKDVTTFTLSGSNYQLDVLETEDDISPVDLDTGQFGQVLQNLVINSDQAMPDGGAHYHRVADCTIGDRFPDSTAAGQICKDRYCRTRGSALPGSIFPVFLTRTFRPKERGAVSAWPRRIQSSATTTD